MSGYPRVFCDFCIFIDFQCGVPASLCIYFCKFNCTYVLYKRRRVEEAGTAVESMVQEDPPNARGAWRRMKGWYRDAATRGPPPARATLERLTAEQTGCIAGYHPPGENIPVTFDPTHIDDLVPTEDKVEVAVKKLRRNRSGGPSRIRAEHVKGWLAAASRGGVAEDQGERRRRRRRREGGDDGRKHATGGSAEC